MRKGQAVSFVFVKRVGPLASSKTSWKLLKERWIRFKVLHSNCSLEPTTMTHVRASLSKQNTMTLNRKFFKGDRPLWDKKCCISMWNESSGALEKLAGFCSKERERVTQRAAFAWPVSQVCFQYRAECCDLEESLTRIFHHILTRAQVALVTHASVRRGRCVESCLLF